ncbi:hypothetical protein HW132_34580 [Brasilonema sp. CT11]|nr:hypothetical protein [Brasilonema sp. CT11]
MQKEKINLTQRALAIANLYYDGDLDKAVAYMILIGCGVLEKEAKETFKSRGSEFNLKN